jgi:large repetitive protein
LGYAVSKDAAWLSAAGGGNTPGSISVSVNPSGLEAGSYSGQVTITSSAAGNSPQTVAVNLTVNPPVEPLQITTTSLPAGTVGQQYSYQLTATGGVQPYTWSLSNRRSLPNSFNLSSAGVLSGKPNAAGTYTFTVTIRDSATNSVGKSLTLIINVRPPRR